MCTFVWLLGENRSTMSICCAGISKRIGGLKCLMGAFKAANAMYMYILYKFGGLLSGSYAVIEAQLCMQASISTRVNASTFTSDNTFVFRYYSLGGDTAMPDGLYAIYSKKIAEIGLVGPEIIAIEQSLTKKRN